MKHFKKLSIILSVTTLTYMLLYFTGCSGDDEPINQLKGMWKASDTEYYSFQDKTIIIYDWSYNGLGVQQGNYVYDAGSQNIYVSVSGESATLHIEKIDKNSLVLKNIKENEVLVLNRHTVTINELPQELTGYTLRGLGLLEVCLDSKNQFRFFDPEYTFWSKIYVAAGSHYEVKELGYSYEKKAANKATLTLNYSIYVGGGWFGEHKTTGTAIVEIIHYEDILVKAKYKETSKTIYYTKTIYHDKNEESTHNWESDYYNVVLER